MPVYEFYCAECHTIFNFLSRRVNTEKRPDCPRCGRPELERQVSSFAVSKGRPEAGEDPEKIEEEMGDALDVENPFAREGVKGLKRRFLAPQRDETLYEM